MQCFVHSVFVRRGAVALVAMFALVFLSDVTVVMAQDNKEAQLTYSIVIHGGAGGDPARWTEDYQQQRRVSLTKALKLGEKMLREGRPALDVVEQVVRSMEDDPVFNAGRGCVLNENGNHELDACIMDGRDLRCGAVAASTTAKHPITLARKVMENTRHVLLIGTGANEFGQAAGVEQADASWFRTERKIKSWEKWKAGVKDASLHSPSSLQMATSKNRAKEGGDVDELYLGTVGCVALDADGNLAAATSTGGLMGKRWGRVGDSPIVGAGNYADNRTCAVSGTGVGEEFIRLSVAKDISARMQYGGRDLQDAANETVAQLPADAGGVIAVDSKGNAAMPFNTPGMSRGHANSNGEFVVLLGRENE